MAELQDLSATDASNTARFPENQAPSTVNNGARALEGMLARWYADTNGSIVSAGTDTVTLAASRTITAYAQGQVFVFEAGGTNTGAVTLNVDSVGPKAVVKRFNVALASGDIVAGQIVAVAYEATADNFQLLTPIATAPTDQIAAASETVAGKVELATNAETVTGSDTARAVTPANVTARLAAPGAIGGTTPAAANFTTIGASGDMTMTAASTFQAEGAAVASVAGATDIWAVSDGDTVHVTGVETITSLGTAPQAGCWKKLIFDGVLVLTQGANLNLNAGGANITTAAGDIAYVYADTTTQMDVLFFKKSGVANVVAAAAGWTIMTPQAVTSGSSVTFGSIPAGVKKIAVSFRSMSATAANRTFSVTLGDAGGLEVTGYIGMALNLIATAGALTTNPVALSSDIQVVIGDPSAAGDTYSGVLELTLENSSSFRWAFKGIVSSNTETSGAQYMGMVSGVKALSAELTQLSVVVDGTFDGAGEVNVAYAS